MDHQSGSNSITPAAGPSQRNDFIPNNNLRISCSDCKTDPVNLVEEYASGDLVCGLCGLVLGDRIIDTRPEWRNFDTNQGGQDFSRVGQSGNVLMDGLVDQLSTRIGSRDGDSGVAHTLQRTMERRISSSDQVMLNAIDEIQRLCDVIHLPRTVSEMAKTVFKQTMMNEILPNKKEIDFFIAATIYYSCKVNQVPRTFLEISQLTGVEIKSITKYYQKVKLVHQREASGIISTSAVDLIPRYCNHLGLDMQFTRCSKDIACTVESQGILAGKNPITIASACIFMTTQLLGNHQTIQSISRVSGMSETTIRDAFQVLSGNRSGILVPTLLSRYPHFDVTSLQ